MKKLILSLFLPLCLTAASAQGLSGDLNSDGAVDDGLSSVVGGLSDDAMSSTLYYEYEDEYGYVTNVQSATIGDMQIRLIAENKLLLTLTAQDAAQGAVVTVFAPDGRQLARQEANDVETIIPLPASKVVVAKVE